MGMIEIQVQGMPGAQGSKVSTKWGGMKESSKRVGPWRAQPESTGDVIVHFAPAHLPLEVPIIIPLPPHFDLKFLAYLQVQNFALCFME